MKNFMSLTDEEVNPNLSHAALFQLTIPRSLFHSLTRSSPVGQQTNIFKKKKKKKGVELFKSTGTPNKFINVQPMNCSHFMSSTQEISLLVTEHQKGIGSLASMENELSHKTVEKPVTNTFGS